MWQQLSAIRKNEQGTAMIEEVVLVATVAIGFAAAAVPLGRLLLDFHRAIEWILWLPIP